MRQERLLALVRAYGARLVGPNCLGIAVAAPRLNATFGPKGVPSGNVGLLVAERRARPCVARARIGARLRTLRVRLDRQQGGRVLQRPARVLGGRSGYERGDALPRVVRQSVPLRPHRPPRRAQEADLGDEEWNDPRGRARGELAHRGALAGSEAAVDALFAQAGVIRTPHARGAHRRRRAALDAAASTREARGRADERGRARNSVRRRVRGCGPGASDARAADAVEARRGSSARGEPRKPDRHARLGNRKNVRGRHSARARRQPRRCASSSISSHR